ncbi:MAG TPA: serine hydrolase domain-containing protein [Steroidobacteraceae bacterium]|jgi:CubicO group peptidase (beta-lactamase class C family)
MMDKTTRRSFLAGAGMTAAASLMPRGAAAGSPVQAPADLQPLIARERENILATLAKDDVPGAAVCLLYEGKPAWIEGFGVTDRQTQRPVGSGTIFSIQSTSKNFTATAIMLAVQRGLLDLDRPITAYLPNFTVQSRFETEPQEKMTLRLLLGHRAGFTHEAPVGNNYDPAFPDFEAHILSISQTWLRYPVGERYRYSNLGIDVAGYILQLACRRPFADCLRTMVFEPLNMADSTVATEVYAARKDRAVGHEKGYISVPLKTPLIPSGGVYTSARDMAAYLAFQLNRGRAGDKTLLRESLWQDMHSFSLGGDYGLGVIRTELCYGDSPIRVLNHLGGGFGFGCVFSYCPEAQLGWAAMFNRPTSAPYRMGEGLLDGILARRYGARRARVPARNLPIIQPQESRLKSLVGNYLGRSAPAEITLEDGTLTMKVKSASTPLQFSSPTDAFVAAADGDAVTYRYFAGTQGEAAHFECFIGENSLDYNDGPNDPAGPDSSSWDAFVGQYAIEQWGQRAKTVSVHRKNGYLYFDEKRLNFELEPGLFFMADGEAVDFRHTPATWRSIRLQRL